MNRKMLGAALGAAMMIAATTAARAEDGQMRVDLSGLDLNTAAGAKAALGRIETNAGVFCEDGAGRQPLERVAVVQQCVAQMTRKSVSALNAPVVTAMSQGRPATDAAVAVAIAQK